MSYILSADELMHYGVKGMKWGQRRRLKKNKSKVAGRAASAALNAALENGYYKDQKNKWDSYDENFVAKNYSSTLKKTGKSAKQLLTEQRKYTTALEKWSSDGLNKVNKLMDDFQKSTTSNAEAWADRKKGKAMVKQYLDRIDSLENEGFDLSTMSAVRKVKKA